MTESSSRYWLFGAVLTVLGVWSGWLPASHAASITESPAPSASSATGVRTPSSNSVEPTERPPDPCAKGQTLIDDYATLYGGSGKPAWSRADYLLALVPDPELTGHTSSFAAVLEGLEEAVAAEGDVNGEPTSRGHLVRDREWLPWGADTPQCAETAPGVLLFRPQDPSVKPPLVVLLVGETPTWGVRVKQLQAALARVPDGDQALKVLGPTFSGTAASLIASLTPGSKKFELVSGTATSPALRQLFEPLAFSATVPNDDELQQAMLKYLRARGGPADRIAILSEAGTVYGSSVSNAKSESRGASAKPEVPPIELRFPVDLSPLRQAVASAPAPAASGEAGSAPPEDPHVLVLDEVARELSQQRVRFVGVVATDPTDVILLTGRLRSKIPDARFFTIGGDIQFSDPNLVGSLNGMLVAHVAPPEHFDDAAHAGKQERSVSLKSEVVRNVYLAGRQLLGHPSPKPVARISLIGNGALWEIGDDKPRATPPNSWRTVSLATLLVFVVILSVVVWPWLADQLPGEPAPSRHGGPFSLAFCACKREDLSADNELVNAALLSVVAGAVLLMFVTEYAHPHPFWCACAAALVLSACWSGVVVSAYRGSLKKALPSALLCSLLALCATGLALGIGCGRAHEATLNLLSGGSGVLAGLIGFGMLGVGLWCWRLRLRFIDTHRFSGSARADQPPLAEAFGETEDTGVGLFRIERQLLRAIHSPWSGLPAVPLAVHAVLALSVSLIYSVRAPTAFEPGWRNGLVIGFGLLSLLPITVNFSRIVATWVLLNRLLRDLTLFPILEPLRKLPKKLVRNLEQQLTVPNADLTDLAPLIEQLLRISPPGAELRVTAEKAESAWRAALREQNGAPRARGALPLGQIMDLLLSAAPQLPASNADADNYRALLVAIFIPRYLRHFRLYVVPVLLGSVLGVMMTSLYFVQPQRLISTVIFLWVAGMVLGAFLIYSSLDRSAVVSAIGDTTEGSVDLDWTLFSRILTWGVVPLLSLFAAQNPNFSNWVSVLINAFAKTLR